MGSCLSVIINACNEMFLSAIPSPQPSTTVSMESASSSTGNASQPPSGSMASTSSSTGNASQPPSGSMASTSSSPGNASQPLVACGKFEVFINHRGIDVKTSLASTIYNTLELIGVRAFLDRDELEAGEESWDAIKKAISDALVHIAIFSPNYAQSPWCLDELELMLQSGKKIIPIFYHVEPSHLRWVAEGKEGVYSAAFSKHEEKRRYTSQQLEEWKKALKKASYLYGFEINERQKDEGQLLKTIVNNVIAEMGNNQLLDVARHPVGLDTAVEIFENFVKTHFECAQSKHNVKVVGIVGMGGCGKTTLVKEYFNRKRSTYQSSSFLFDVRDAAAKGALPALQAKLLEDLVHLRLTFRHTCEGKRTLEDRVRSVKALIILDDVDHLEQMDALLPLKGNLRSDSLIVVTTRDKDLIESSASLSSSVSPYVYKIGGLDPVHATQLFCWHAFLQDSPMKGFEDLVEEFLNACQRLPLSLRVLGGQLCRNNSRDDWESLLHKISKILPVDIKQTLKVSYDALDEEQQQIFLDVACFFIGEQKDMAISIWDGSGSDGFLWSGRHGFRILENKCLVEVDHENCIRMHDHLRDLGREIAIKEKPSRFWSHSQFVNSQRPLEERLPIRGVMTATGFRGFRQLHYDPPFDECMQLLTGHSTSRHVRLTSSALGLQLLVVRGDYFKEQFAKLSEELVWLRWYNFPYGKLPSWLSKGKLRVLELCRSERLEELWGPNDAPPSQLRELIINMSHDFCNLQMIPETIGSLKHLKKLVLKDKFGRTQIQISSLREEFCLLESLEHLELENFSYLSSLPSDFGKLRKLKYIGLRRCMRLTALPVSFNQLTELQYLDLSGCENLQLEKNVLENITELVKLRLRGCFKLKRLPSEITRQVNLRELCLSDSGLRELPAHIDRLAKLEVLEIGGPSLTSLPTTMGNLSSLIKLEIANCPDLKYLPCLGNLSCLIKLTICDCRGVKHLPPVGCLTGLEHLKLENLDVEYLPEGFGQLVNLQNLEICGCPIRDMPLAKHVNSSMFKTEMLRRLKSIRLVNIIKSTISISEDCCPSLEDLHLSRNVDLLEIETLPTTLKTVEISSCEKLKNIRCVGGLVKLQGLNISNCPGLDELPSFAGLVELQRLQIGSWSQLHKLPSFAGPAEIQGLVIDKCLALDEMPSFAGLVELQSLVIASWSQLHKLPSFAGLEKIQNLQISNCPALDELPSFAGLVELQRLNICDCSQLHKLPSFAGLAKIQALEIRKCPALDELPSFAGLVELQSLEIYICSQLHKLPSFAGLAKIQNLQISNCPALDELPSFAGLVELQRLVIASCSQLHKLPSFAGLAKIQALEIRKCPGLDGLASFACCTCLEELKIKVSSRVTKIEGIEELRSLKTLRLETDWKVAGIKGLKNMDKLTRLQIRGESRSAIETCIPPNIVERPWPCDVEIVGRAVEDVESGLGSLTFPNFIVVDKLHRSDALTLHPKEGRGEWEMAAGVSNASCVIVCFVFSSRCQGNGFNKCRLGSHNHSLGLPFLGLDGKQVYIKLFPEGFHFRDDFKEVSNRVFLTLNCPESVEIEKGMAVLMGTGEENNAFEPLHNFLKLLKP